MYVARDRSSLSRMSRLQAKILSLGHSLLDYHSEQAEAAVQQVSVTKLAQKARIQCHCTFLVVKYDQGIVCEETERDTALGRRVSILSTP